MLPLAAGLSGSIKGRRPTCLGIRSRLENANVVRHVVTVFLTRERKLLILRRSARVGSYSGRWAGVSGYIEGRESPYDRAIAELQEELSISSQNVTLVRKGEPLPVIDPELKVVWVVHPFLFELTGGKLKLDWEHSEHRWVAFDQLEHFSTVPKLVLTAKRAIDLPRTFPDSLRRALNLITADRTHGARYITEQLLRAILRLCEERPQDVSDRLLDDIWLEACSAHPLMAPLWNMMFSLHSPSKARIGRRLASTVQGRAKACLEDLRASFSRTVGNGVGMIKEGSRVATISNSGTVYGILREAHRQGRLRRVLIAESRPLYEGFTLAQMLARMGAKVTVYADTSIPLMASEADLALVGGDAVWADGSLVNKVGTSTLARFCSEGKVPFLCAVETMKFDLRSLLDIPPTPQSTPDAKSQNPESIESIFDVTPPHLITGFITERGIAKPDDVRAVMSEMLRSLLRGNQLGITA